MNLIWNKNKKLFASRFPSLAEKYAPLLAQEDVPHPFWEILPAKDGSVCAAEQGKKLHSAYNPLREAEQAVLTADKTCTAGVFFAIGLGYTVQAFASRFPDKTIIIVENDAARFFAALALTDFSAVFAVKNCVCALECPAESVIPLITHEGITRCAFFSTAAQTEHSQPYFNTLKTLVERNRRTEEVNNATLEKFSKLWLRNSCTNLRKEAELAGVNIYGKKPLSSPLPFLVLAAGPSLENILPSLSELKKHSVLICVDTALRACLRVHVEPDFIILTDPQYWAWRHIAGLSSPQSVLITESAVYPAVFRFACRKTVLCDSLFPLGKYFEKQLGAKGDLGSGGSVASCAWNFAYSAGAAEIFTAGLDLAYPGGNTHIKGSTFEQSVHTTANRTAPAETSSVPPLFAAGREKAQSYNGNEVCTDTRMKLFAWWFESRLASCPDIRTYTFCPDGMKIPGIQPAELSALLTRPDITEEKKDFITSSEASEAATAETEQRFETVYGQFIDGMQSLYETAKKGKYVCEQSLAHPEQGYAEVFLTLEKLDAEIIHSSLKEAVSLVFPTSRQLELLMKNQPEEKDDRRANIRRTLVIYSELCRAVQEYLFYTK